MKLFNRWRWLYSSLSLFLLLAALPHATATPYPSRLSRSGNSAASLSQTEVRISLRDEFAAETGADAAIVQITRAGDLSQALIVNYRITGSAQSGTDFEPLTGTAILPADASEVLVRIQPLDDADAEPPETVTLTLEPSSSYTVRAPLAATVMIHDTETPAVRIDVVDEHMYERLELDTGAVRISRLGDLNRDLQVNLTSAGTAVAATDYTPVDPSVFLLSGEASATAAVTPIDDAELEGTETIIVQIAPGDGYTVSAAAPAATLLLRDSEDPPGALLFAEDFELETASRWQVKFAANNGVTDFDVLFGDDYQWIDGLPAAPHSAEGTSRGLYLTVNKNDPTEGGAAALNIYPASPAEANFSGNYALRFDLAIRTGTQNTTEHVLVGINHTSQQMNWHRQDTTSAMNSPGASDGIWFAISSDGSNRIDYGLFARSDTNPLPQLILNRSAASVAGFVPRPPYTPSAGSPANSIGSSTPTWAEIEVAQINNIITLSVNRAALLTYTNTTPYKSGTIMVGYNDPFDSIGQGYAYIDNIRVIRLASRPAITSARASGDQLVIDFTVQLAAPQASLKVEASSAIRPALWQEIPATITSVGPQQFRAVVSKQGPQQFYRIKL